MFFVTLYIIGWKISPLIYSKTNLQKNFIHFIIQTKIILHIFTFEARRWRGSLATRLAWHKKGVMLRYWVGSGAESWLRTPSNPGWAEAPPSPPISHWVHRPSKYEFPSRVIKCVMCVWISLVVSVIFESCRKKIKNEANVSENCARNV